ncbi:FecR family protein [Butyricimonas paravirosa]|uniref:FecR family protein n=1 Tax=Butyricimonas paravirosa TaxID=1472417 RepID=UPI0021096453|nr:FecR domain-containing protein [Butyricimonas paravirosa]
MTDRMHINWDIIVRRILDQADETERELVERWLTEDEMNREYYRKAKRYFDRYYTGEESREVDVEDAWSEFVVYADKSPRKYLWRRVMRYAAVLLLPLCLGLGYWFWGNDSLDTAVIPGGIQIEPGTTKAILVFNSGRQVELTDSSTFEQAMGRFKSEEGKVEKSLKPVEYNKIIVPRGGEYNLVLADGTSVVINADSKLSIPDRFEGKERRVRLEGEALFHVVKDAEHPFVVEMEGGDVTVLGTVFNVSAYSEEVCIQTTLVEGSVAFRGKGMKEVRVIVPGEQVTYDVQTNSVEVEKVDTGIYTAWAEGKWIIEGKRLEDIMKQLARWYDVSVFYQNPEVKDLVFTGDLEKYSSCNVILDIISMTTNVEFELKDKMIIVKMK